MATEDVDRYLARPVGFTRQYDFGEREPAELRCEGLSPREMAQHYGCSVTTIERALRRYGLVGW